MKNAPRGMFGVVLLIFATAAPLLAQEEKKEPTSATEIWGARCAECHAEGGGGVDGKAKSLLTDAAMGEGQDRPFYELLRKADGPHVSAKGLTEQQTWSLVVHLREMQAKEWRKRVGDPKPDKKGVYASQRARFKIETVVEKGLETPWSIEWLPLEKTGAPRRSLVTEKDGRLNVYDDGKLVGQVSDLPKLVSHGQGGLLDVAAHPDYAKNGWVYLACADPSEDGKREITKIVRGKLTPVEPRDGKPGGWSFTDQEVVFQARKDHYFAPGVHYGCRIVFQMPGQKLAAEANGRWLVYFGIGERGRAEMAQMLDRPNGKVHRLWDDGKVPSDNPFVSGAGGVKDVYPSIYSYGHRNPQGLAFDDQGNLFDTEHGPRGGDELNLIERGKDYGWPEACFGINYSDAPFVTPWTGTTKAGTPITMPIHRWLPSIAACGLDCARATNVKGTFPQWSGDLFAGGLAGATVQRLRVKDGKLIESEEIIHGMGRVRDVAFGPDGYLYIVLNGPDKVIRLVPAGADKE